MFLFFGSFIISLLLGGLSVLLTSRLRDKLRLRVAHEEAEDILQEARDQATQIANEAKERATQIEDDFWAQNEAELAQLQAVVSKQEESYRSKRSQADREYNQDQREIQKQMSLLAEREKKVESREQFFTEKKNQLQKLKSTFIVELQKISKEEPEEVKKRLVAAREHELQIEAKRKANIYEEEVRQEAESTAKRMIGIVLNRFARQSSLERGIGNIEVENEEQKAHLTGPEMRNFKIISEAFGVDLTIGENNMVQISGFDPVRREMTARLLEKMLKEKDNSADNLQRLIEKTKKEVVAKIDQDGKKIAQELGMNDLHSEIKKTLGCLRYRYSFAQNQYFHVGEVGWICGILAAELGSVDISSAKRSGLLHDIGKAMDHSIEGGHAVIGADFIKNLGEKEAVVHAVRAHHYEEQPNTDLAFLVIAADAISGSRPGARRSTVSSYNQKIEALSTIADSFKGVTRTMVFNAGREVRITVDARRVNDQQSLKLCRDIADKIEAECSYPGQIKVVVVRETHAEAQAK